MDTTAEVGRETKGRERSAGDLDALLRQLAESPAPLPTDADELLREIAYPGALRVEGARA